MNLLAKSILIIFFTAVISGCPFGKTKKSEDHAQSESPEAKLIARGRAVYLSNCTSCHNINPKLPGSQGPDIHASSKELLTARLLYAKYPDGYKPKRASNIMPAMPHLANDIDALTAYLNQP
jgi:mono/diheme cytochrome c family protein